MIGGGGSNKDFSVSVNCFELLRLDISNVVVAKICVVVSLCN